MKNSNLQNSLLLFWQIRNSKTGFLVLSNEYRLNVFTIAAKRH